jgi:hypothetical protein
VFKMGERKSNQEEGRAVGIVASTSSVHTHQEIVTSNL